jgi:VanZ family protein
VTTPSRSATVTTALALAVILMVTLRAEPAQLDRAAETAWHCIVCGEAGVTDVLLNILLFVPFGIGLRAMGLRSWPAALVALLVTLAVESTQAIGLAGRDASVGDVVANTAGGLLGWLLWGARGWIQSPSRWRARSLVAALSVASAAAWLFTAWGLQPDGSSRGPWVGQRTRVWRGHDPFPGSLGLATIGDIEIPDDPLISRPVLSNGFTLSLLLMRQDSTTPDRPVSILRVIDGEGRLQLGVAQRGEDLLVSSRVRASRWRVRTPTWRFEDVMRIPTDVPWSLQWQWQHDGVALRSASTRSGGPSATHAIPFSVGLGWVYVHPFAAAIGRGAFGWTALWLACWMLPLGWLLRWLTRREAMMWGAVVVACYIGASLVSGLPVQWREVVVVVGWMGIGRARLPRPYRDSGASAAAVRPR